MVERLPSKQDVASSNLVSRSNSSVLPKSRPGTSWFARRTGADYHQTLLARGPVV